MKTRIIYSGKSIPTRTLEDIPQPLKDKAWRILAYCEKNPECKVKDIEKYTRISEPHTYRLVKALVESKKLVEISCKCGRTYLYSVDESNNPRSIS